LGERDGRQELFSGVEDLLFPALPFAQAGGSALRAAGRLCDHMTTVAGVDEATRIIDRVLTKLDNVCKLK
jgi:hypothetical protein